MCIGSLSKLMACVVLIFIGGALVSYSLSYPEYVCIDFVILLRAVRMYIFHMFLGGSMFESNHIIIS